MKKVKMKTSLILVFAFLLTIPLISALIPGSTDATIKITPVSTIPNWNSSTIFNGVITFNVSFSDSEFGNTKSYLLSISPNKTFTSTQEFKVLFIKDESEDITTLGKLLQCMTDKGSCERSYTICNAELSTYKGTNATQCKDDLATCNLLVKEKDLVLSTKQEKITDLEDEKESTKNSNWIYALVGLCVGAGGFYLYNKNKGGGSVKDRSTNEWSRGQAG